MEEKPLTTSLRGTGRKAGPKLSWLTMNKVCNLSGRRRHTFKFAANYGSCSQQGNLNHVRHCQTLQAICHHSQ